MRITNVLKNIVTKTLTQRSEKEVVVKAPWGDIRALTWGDPSHPPVCLVHGRLDTCSSFRPLVSTLPDTYFYVSIDLPGGGLSDHLPKGVRYSVMDLIPSVVYVRKYFQWEHFAYIGHSLGVLVGKYFNLAYPGQITKFVELDPVPAYFTWDNSMDSWYKLFYEGFYGDSYHKLNGGKETAPKYTYEKVEQMMMKARGLSKESIAHILERALQPAGDGLYRITYDQRMKFVSQPLMSKSHLQQLYTSLTTPTLCILAKKSIDNGDFDQAPFIRDPSCWPNNNYKVKIVEGNHDVHIENPNCMARDIAEFLQA